MESTHMAHKCLRVVQNVIMLLLFSMTAHLPICPDVACGAQTHLGAAAHVHFGSSYVLLVFGLVRVGWLV